MRNILRKLGACVVALLYGLWSVVAAHGYAFNEIVPDVRQPSNISAGPQRCLHTAEWLKPKARPNSWVRMDSRSYDFVWVPSACGVAKDVSESQAQTADDDPTGLRVLYPDRATLFMSAPSRDTSFRQILFPCPRRHRV